MISLNLLSNSPLEWNVVTEKVTKTAKRRGAVMEFEMSKMPLTPLKAFTWVGALRRKLCVWAFRECSLFSEDKIRLHLTWIESKTRNLRWKVLTTICSKFIQSGFHRPLFLRFQWNCWSSPNTTVTDDPGTGERKKVRETFYRRFQRVKEAEEDTMLCWNIQRKRLLTQVKAPRELILVFIRHRRKSTEQDQNERRPIRFEGRLSICYEDFNCND